MHSSRPGDTPTARRRRTGRALVVALAITGLVAAGAPAACAATTTAWATWGGLAGAPGAYTSTMTLAGQPALTADVTSDSRGGGGVGVISGTSIWLSEGTPIGAKYGTSRGLPYLNLGASSGAPSTTTYTFATPAPASGWAFALGDIDADSVRISGLSATGAPLTAADVGFQSGFNYCAPGLAGKPSCTGDAADVPAWDPTTLTLTGNPAASDTSGAAAWFEPTVAIGSLTFTFTVRLGIPVYQTWFASMARDITGTVSDTASGPLDGVEVSLTDANGVVVATTTTSAGGSYAFPGFFATDGYEVTAVPPPGKIGVIVSGTADLRTQDAVVDLTVRDIASLSGTVTMAGSGAEGVTVTATGPNGTLTTTTDADGAYAFPLIGDGTFVVAITVPDGTVAVTAASREEVVTGSDLTAVDFEIATAPTTPPPVDPDPGTDPGPGPGTGGSGSADGPGSELAASGADSTPLLAAGLIALLAGGALITTAHRRPLAKMRR